MCEVVQHIQTSLRRYCPCETSWQTSSLLPACNGLVHHKTHEFNFSLVRADPKLTVVEVELIFFVASNATTTICSKLYLLRICIEFAFDIT